LDKQAVLVTLDKPRQLRYRHAALSALEQHFGCKMADIGDKLDKPGIEDMVVLLWAGLLWEDKELTLESVGKLIDNGESGIGELLAAILTAFDLAFETSKNATRPAANGTGRKH
jgi:hypothetical protein